MKLGNGTVFVTVPKQASLQCEILQHASDCNNYNVPGSIEGMEVRRCQGQSPNTLYLVVVGKQLEKFEPEPGEAYLAGFVEAWSQCMDAKPQSSGTVEIDGKMGMDFVMRTPLGNGASRALVANGYSVMVLAIPKYKGSKEEIQQFVTSLRQAKQSQEGKKP